MAEEMKAIPEVEAIERLSERSEASLEFNQQLLLEHGNVLKKIGSSKKAFEELLGLGLPEEAAAKLADVMPKTPETITLALNQFGHEVSEEEINKILKITKGE